MRLWVADVEKGLMLLSGGAWRRAGPPCRALCPLGQGVCWAGEKEGGVSDGDGRTLLRFPVPPGVCALTAAGDRLYLLSADADSVTALDAATGRPLFAAPAGAYPRSLAVSPDGRLLAAAGGAAGEVLIFDGALRRQRAYRVPGIAVGVCFHPRGLTALCEVEDGALCALALRINSSGVSREVFSCPDAPCCLCPLGDGCAVGCRGRVMFLSGRDQIRRQMACACPRRIRALGRAALIADPWQGRVLLSGGACLYTGGSPEDALIL